MVDIKIYNYEHIENQYYFLLNHRNKINLNVTTITIKMNPSHLLNEMLNINNK